MENLLSLENARRVGHSAEAWVVENLLTVWSLSQVGLILLSASIAVVIHRAARPHLDTYVESLQTNVRLRRLFRSANRLIGPLAFLVCVFGIGAVFRIRYAEYPSNILRLSMSLATAWLVVRLLTGAIADQRAARAIGWFIWGLAALDILGLLEPITLALDNVGTSIGDSRFTLLTVSKGILLLAVLLWAALFSASILKQRLHTSGTISPRTQVLIAKLAKFALIAFAIIVSLSAVGVNLAALAVFAGAMGVGIGIGLQHQVSNLISGLFLLLDKSIKPGDVIEVGESYGWVREMSARYVGVITRDNKEILIPNDAFVLNQVINWSHSDRRVRLEVKFRAAYSADPHRVRKLTISAAHQVKRVASEPPAVCHVTAFGESSIDFVLRFWISDPESGVTNVKGEVLLVGSSRVDLQACKLEYSIVSPK